jgi:hypothetical protein
MRRTLAVVGLTATKRGRLAVIIGVAVVIVAGIAIFNRTTSSNADDDAHDFARLVYEQLEDVDYEEVDAVWAEAEIAGWTGDRSPFEVDGRVPEVIREIAGGLVARYRILSNGLDRCVDALWPDDGAFSVDVNACERYQRP